MNRKRPEAYLKPFRKLDEATLQENETPAMLMHFEAINPNGPEKVQNIFSVIRRGDKAIGRVIIKHENTNEDCHGHASEVAEYPIEDINDLIEEIAEQCIAIALMMTLDTSNPMSVNMDEAAVMMRLPEGITHQELLNTMNEDKDPRSQTAITAIKDILGLENEKNVTTLSKNENESTSIQDLPLASEVLSYGKAEKIERATTEKNLIKKYGKKNMEALAVKMNYKGEILNKTK